METLGGLFRQTREQQRLTLEQIASITRIQQRHLQALEEEDFASLPAKVFVKGFVRSYARTLGLDEDNAIQLFLTTSNDFYDRTQEEEQHIQVTLQAAHRKRFNWNLFVILFLAIGGVLIYLLPWQQETLPPTPTPESETPLPINGMPNEGILEPAPPIEESPDRVSSEASVDAEVQLPTPSPSGITPSPLPPVPQPISPTLPVSPVPEKATVLDGTLVLEIEATQLTWVVVQSDDQAPQEALLQPGQKSTWKANKQYLLTLGNAAGVIIRLNGELQGPFGKPGQVVRDIRLKP